jgi:hypothetical protein
MLVMLEKYASLLASDFGRQFDDVRHFSLD